MPFAPVLAVRSLASLSALALVGCVLPVFELTVGVARRRRLAWW